MVPEWQTSLGLWYTLIKTTRRDWIEWTPNVITSKVIIKGEKARVFLGSCTPNFRSFQRIDESGRWRDCDEEVELLLDSHVRMDFTFRTVNLFGVTGPEHHVRISYQPPKSIRAENHTQKQSKP